MSTGWSIYVIALVVLNIIGCAWLILWTAKRRPGDPKPDETSHVWDGNLTEYNKPLPKWWVNLFWLTIVFSIGYLIWYPGLGSFAGTSKWTSADEVKQDQKVARDLLDKTFAPYAGKSIDVLAQDPKAVALGKSIFGNTCATCHGSAAKGAIGYPNLTDNIWKWGGTPQDVLTSIQQGREGIMAPWGKVLEGTGGPKAVDAVIAYVRTLADPSLMKNNYLAAQGKPLYDGVCVACHGADGKGNQQLGAPDLTDKDWLYGDSDASLRETIANGRHGVMPAHLPILGDTRTRLVGAYVWSLSKHDATATAPAATPAAATAEPAAAAAAPALDPARDAIVYFDTASAALSDADKQALAKLAETMKADANVKVTISGFHDATGSAAKNAELAKDRAVAVRDTLTAAGVDAARITMEKPAETTGSGDPREARRVEVHVK